VAISECGTSAPPALSRATKRLQRGELWALIDDLAGTSLALQAVIAGGRPHLAVDDDLTPRG
jgi:hypothetical protein